MIELAAKCASIDLSRFPQVLKKQEITDGTRSLGQHICIVLKQLFYDEPVNPRDKSEQASKAASHVDLRIYELTWLASSE